jgi:fibronectin type 3 domain-containing protein
MRTYNLSIRFSILIFVMFFISAAAAGFSFAADSDKVVIGADDKAPAEKKSETAAETKTDEVKITQSPEKTDEVKVMQSAEKTSEDSKTSPEKNEEAADKDDTGKRSEKKGKEDSKKIEPPSFLTASAAGGRVKLNWEESAGAHHYNIYRDSSQKITKKASRYNTNQNEFEDEDAKEGETYYYFVTAAAKNPGGKAKYIESEPAGPVKVETIDKTPPETVISLKADHAENGRVRLVWSKPAGGPEAAQYIVLRGESESASALKEIKTLAAESFEEDGLENETPYFYAVAAVSKNGVKGAISSIIAVRLKDTLAPEAPKNIVAAAHAGRIELSWERPKDADTAYYTIYKSEDGGNDFKKIPAPSLITEGRFTDKSVRGGKEYQYKITASDKCANESKPSDPAVMIKIKVPLNVRFARSGEKSYYGFSYNHEQRSLYVTDSADGKTWSWWNVMLQNFPLPEDFSDDCRISFAKDGKKITAFVYDTEKMSISVSVSGDEGKNWKWWEVYSSSLPLPDGFDENTRIDFSVKGNLVYCICYNPSAQTLSAASTTDGKSWKWWKKFGENLSALPNQSANSLNSACFYGGQFEAFSYNLDDKTLYKGILPADKTNYVSWNEVSSKFPAPPQ